MAGTPQIIRPNDPNTGKPMNAVVFANMVLSFPHLIKATLNTSDKDPRNHYLEYSGDVLIPKTVDLSVLEGLFAELAAKKWPDYDPEPKSPIKDGDKKINNKRERKPMTEYHGHWYVTVRTKEANGKPMCVDLAKKPLERPDDIVGGDVCNVLANAFAYDANGNVGFSFSPHTIKLIEKSTAPFGGGISASAGMDVMDQYDPEVSTDDMV